MFYCVGGAVPVLAAGAGACPEQKERRGLRWNF